MPDFVRIEDERRATCAELGIHNGQMKLHGWKNLCWAIERDGKLSEIGFGDLSEDNLETIQEGLSDDSVFFAGWRDRHTSIHEHPGAWIIRIDADGIETTRIARDIF